MSESMTDDLLDSVATEVGKPYGMTASEVVQMLAIGVERHPDAPDDDCGKRDPRAAFNHLWCTLPPDHDGGFHHTFARQAGLR